MTKTPNQALLSTLLKSKKRTENHRVVIREISLNHIFSEFQTLFAQTYTNKINSLSILKVRKTL